MRVIKLNANSSLMGTEHSHVMEIELYARRVAAISSLGTVKGEDEDMSRV